MIHIQRLICSSMLNNHKVLQKKKNRFVQVQISEQKNIIYQIHVCIWACPRKSG
jgi:hypothetical protein